MVLSNKKLKQRRRAEAVQEQGDATHGPPSTLVSKREKKRQRREQPKPQDSPPQQSESPATVIEQIELDTYHRCLSAVLQEHDEAQSAHTEPSPPEVEAKASSGATSSNKPNAPTSNGKASKRKKSKEKTSVTEQQEEKAPDESEKHEDSSDPKTIYVGGIPYYSSEDDIKAFFGDCGTISEVNLKTFSDSGKFCGIALLTFKTVGAAERALALDGANMGDRFLKVQRSAAKPKGLVKKEVYNGPPTKMEGYTRAYIGNLSWSVTEEDIRNFFKDCKIDNIRFSQDKETGDFQGFGHVDFSDDQSLELALRRDQEVLLERPMKVAYAVPKKSENRTGKAMSRDKKDVTCYSCGEKGHISSRCPYMGRAP